MSGDLTESKWDNVPTRLRYLVDAARRYENVRFDSEIDALISQISAEDRHELEQLGRKVKERGDYELVNDWLDHYDMCQHPEAAAVYFLFGILWAMDISFE